MIHTVKGFSVVNKADAFLEFPCFFYDPADVGNLMSGSFNFSISSLYIWNVSIHLPVKLSLKDLSINLLTCELRMFVWWLEHSLALPFFGIGMKTDLSQSCSHCWIFQICWHIEYSILTASSFRIWNSSAGIPSHHLALFVIMPCLPPGHFPTQSSNPGLLHCRQVLYHLSHKGSPRILKWISYPFSRGSSRPQNWTRVS